MGNDRYINPTKQQHWPSSALCFAIEGVGKRKTKFDVSFSKAYAWANIHSWNPRYANITRSRVVELNAAEVEIVKLCDYDMTMMRLVSALSGIHIDLSELTIKPA